MKKSKEEEIAELIVSYIDNLEENIEELEKENKELKEVKKRKMVEDENGTGYDMMKDEYEKLEKENKELKEENEKLQNKLNKLKKIYVSKHMEEEIERLISD